MGGGLIIGMFWGLVVSAVALAAVSLSMPLPPRDGGQAPQVQTSSLLEAIEAEAEADLTDASVEEPAAEPEIEGDLSDGGAEAPAEEAEAPEAAGDDAALAPNPRSGGETAITDDLALPAGSEFNRPPPEAPATLPEGDAPVDRASGGVAEPVAESQTTPPSPDSAPAPLPSISANPTAPEPGDTGGLTLPQITEAGDGTAPTPAAPAPLSVPEADAPSAVATTPAALPQIEAEPAEEAPVELAAVETTEPAAPRLPQITAPVEPEATADAAADVGDGAAAEDPAAEATEAAEADAPPNALRDYAVAFDVPSDQALMAVVLIDDPESPLTLDTLTRFTFPVAFAVDPLSDGAAERAQAYRDAGFEVVIWGDVFPEGATESDVAQAIEGATQILSEAVAVMDTAEGRIQADRPILDATVDVLATTGHGLVAFPRGLNAAEQTARRADVPAGTLFRMLDDEDQRATVITRFLSRAGFAAGENGTVIVAGRTRPDTVTALFSWALGGRTGAVTLAPLSAVLLRNAEGG